MDSSHQQNATSSNDKNGCEQKDSTKMVQSKRDKFMSTYLRQSFSLPDSIIYYILKNPPSPELYQKMIQAFKYFFDKNPIVVISRLQYTHGGWRINGDQKPFDLTKFTWKFWLTDKLEVSSRSFDATVGFPNVFASILPKLYRCDAKCLDLTTQTMSYSDFLRIIPSAERIRFINITVKYEDGSTVPLEKIVEVAVKAKLIKIYSPTFTSKTFKNLFQIPHFSQLDLLCMFGITETLNLDDFSKYMKENKCTKFNLSFSSTISDAYSNRLDEIIDEILAADGIDFKRPFVSFVGMDREKYWKLYRLPWYA